MSDSAIVIQIPSYLVVQNRGKIRHSESHVYPPSFAHVYPPYFARNKSLERLTLAERSLLLGYPFSGILKKLVAETRQKRMFNERAQPFFPPRLNKKE